MFTDQQLFGKSKVDQLDVAVDVEQQVLRLEVSVDDVPAVQVAERLDHAGRVEAGCRVVEVAPVSQDGPQLAAQTRLHQHVQVLAVFERLEQLHDEVAVGLAHDLLLGHDVLLLASLNNLQNGTKGINNFCRKRKYFKLLKYKIFVPEITGVFFVTEKLCWGVKQKIVYLRLFHLLEGERSLVIAGDLNELDASEAANAEGGDDAQVLQPYTSELFIDSARQTHVYRQFRRVAKTIRYFVPTMYRVQQSCILPF